jgi:hypothetical protein
MSPATTENPEDFDGRAVSVVYEEMLPRGVGMLLNALFHARRFASRRRRPSHLWRVFYGLVGT